jgi:hypothetical protein
MNEPMQWSCGKSAQCERPDRWSSTIDCVRCPGPPLRFSPGWQNAWAFGPKSQSDTTINPVRLSPEQSTRQVLQQFMPTHPQFVPTFLSPAGTAGRFLLSGDAQVSCQIEGNSEDLCINDRAGIQPATLDSRLRGNNGTPKSRFDKALAGRKHSRLRSPFRPEKIKP